MGFGRWWLGRDEIDLETWPSDLQTPITGWWCLNASETYESVNWDDDTPNISGKIKVMFQSPPTRSSQSSHHHIPCDGHLVLRLVLHRALRTQLSIETSLHQQGDHGHRTHGQLAALPEQGVDQRRDAGRVHAVYVRQPIGSSWGSKGGVKNEGRKKGGG